MPSVVSFLPSQDSQGRFVTKVIRVEPPDPRSLILLGGKVGSILEYAFPWSFARTRLKRSET